MRLRPIELAILAPLAIAAVAVPSAAVPATPAEVAAAAATAFVADAGTGHDFVPAAMPAKTAGLAAIEAPLAQAVNRGWLLRDGARIVPTALGRRFGNDVITLFLDEGPGPGSGQSIAVV